MTGGISQELIITLRADITNLLNGLKKAEAAIERLKKEQASGGKDFSIGGIRKDTLRQMQEAVRYYGVMGDSAGLATKKTQIYQQAIARLSKDGSADAMKLANTYKGGIDRVNASFAKMGGKGAQLGRLGDMLTGGKMSQATKMLGAMGINLGSVAAIAGPVAIGVAAVAAMWKGAIGPGIKFNAMLEQQEVGFRVMLGSAQKASQMMADLKGLAMTTPIGFAEGAEGTKQLLAYGFGQNEIIKNMKLIGTLASATGSNVSELVYVYGTLRAQGQAYTRDLMQFGMRGIPIYEYLAKSLGVSVREIKKLTESGKIGYAEVRKALEAMVGEGGRFNNMLEEQMKTLTGMQTVMRNTWKMAQGEMAKGWMGIAKGYTKSTTSLAKATPSILGPFNKALQVSATLLKPIWDIIVIIAQIIGVIFESVAAIFRLLGNLMKPITDAVVGFFKWLDPLGRVIKFLDKIIDKLKLVGADPEVVPPKWVVPGELRAAVASYADFGRLAASKMVYAYEDQLERAKGQLAQANAILASKTSDATARALAESQRGQATQAIARITTQLEYARQQLGGQSAASFDLIKAFGMDTTSGASQEAIKAFAKNLTSEQVAAVQEALQRDSPKLAISWETALAYISKVTGGILEDTATTLFEEEEAMTIDFWGKIARISDVYSESLMKGFYSTPKEMSTAILKNINDAVANAKEIAENTSSTTAGIVEAQVDQLQTARDSIMETIRRFKPEVEKSGLAIDKAALEELYALALQLDVRIQALGGKAKKETSEYLAEYLKFRSDTMNAESLDLQLQLMALTNNGNLLELYGAQQGVVQMMSDEYRRQYVLLKYNHDLKVAEVNAEYESLKINGVLSDALTVERDLRLKLLNIMLEQNDAQLMLNEGQRLYNEQLSGKEGFWEEVKSRGGSAGQEFGRLTEAINEKYTDPKIIASLKEERRGAFGSMIGGAFADKLGGTQVGSLMAGGNPIVMALSSFAEMLLSIENVGKVLNPFKTALEGTKNIIEGPLNAALKPLVDALVSVGELLGVVLLPIIDLMSSAIGALFGWIKPLFTIFSKFYEALRPLITLFIKLANPIYFLFDILNQLFIALGAIVDATAGQASELEDLYDRQVKALQDLYQVGAISGQEYERRLALLKKGTEEDTVGSYFGEQLNGVFSDLLKSLAEMGVAIQGVLDALLGVFWPVLKPALDLLIIALKIVATAMETIAGIFTGISNTFKALFDLLSGKLSWADAVSAMANGWRTFLNGLQGFANSIIDGINWLTPWPISDIPHVSFAQGTNKLPTDMVANVHEGEMIVPSSFADAIRKGDLSLSKNKQNGNTIININVTAEGSVTTERDLVKTISTELVKLRKMGYA